MRARARIFAATLATALGVATLATAPQAQAADGWSVDITTTKAISYGGRFKLDGRTGHWIWFRPYFTARATVVCPVGAEATLWFSPFTGNQDYTRPVSCTGTPQTIAMLPTGSKGNVLVDAVLRTTEGDLMAEDTQVVRVTATQAK